VVVSGLFCLHIWWQAWGHLDSSGDSIVTTSDAKTYDVSTVEGFTKTALKVRELGKNST
jgi:hypothetical protein